MIIIDTLNFDLGNQGTSCLLFSSGQKSLPIFFSIILDAQKVRSVHDTGGQKVRLGSVLA